MDRQVGRLAGGEGGRLGAKGKVLMGLIVGLVALASLAGLQAHAQFPIDGLTGRYCVFQDNLIVGELYADRTAGGPLYVEHWVVSDRFQGLHPDGSESLMVMGCGDPYGSVQAFLDRVAFGAGYRYIRVMAEETGEIPGRPLGR